MAIKTAQILHKRGLDASLPELSQSELAYTMDKEKLYVGTASGNAEVAKHYYGVSTTAGATPEKIVSLTGFNLVEGARIQVKFTNENTAATPTLNINYTGGVPIVKAGGAVFKSIKKGVYTFVYDGANFTLQGEGGEEAYEKGREISTSALKMSGNIWPIRKFFYQTNDKKTTFVDIDEQGNTYFFNQRGQSSIKYDSGSKLVATNYTNSVSMAKAFSDGDSVIVRAAVIYCLDQSMVTKSQGVAFDYQVYDIATYKDGTVYLSGINRNENYRINKYNKNMTLIATIGNESYNTSTNAFSSIDVDGQGNLYAVKSSGELHKYDKNGNLINKINLGSSNGYTVIHADENYIYYGSTVYGLGLIKATHSGGVVYSSTSIGSTSAFAVLDISGNSEFVITSSNNGIHCLDKKTGKKIWAYELFKSNMAAINSDGDIAAVDNQTDYSTFIKLSMLADKYILT